MKDLIKKTYDNIEKFIETAKATGRFVCKFVFDGMASKPYIIYFGYKNSSDGYQIGHIENKHFNTPSEATDFAKKYNLKPTE